MENTQQHLSPHFTLDEFIASGAARRHNIDNTPQPEHIENLRALCVNALEPLRRRFGVLRITSGYRCPKVNALVGGAPTSQHLSGEAADIHTGSKEASEKMFNYAKSHIPYDQLLLEHKRNPSTWWLHVSYRRSGPQRMEALRMEV
jgi:zinc D-Ala-D-Ala carboxypeptidase